ncbi:hypothetical protein [Pseudomonas huaxiensis]|uniref:hypothetical protein n=1 Tax=Pseudomonas huaxiensis TaxID=2213017 RepID=UPI000DA65CFA|nr:hypothetical protein [Pseudomonas huaxiensis]
MARKSTGKTRDRLLRSDFNKRNPLPEKLRFLENVKFTAVAWVTLPDKVRESTLVEFTAKQVEELLVRREYRYGGALSFLNQRRVKSEPAPVGEALAQAGEVIAELRAKNAELQTRQESLEAEVTKQQRRVLARDRELGEAAIQVSSAQATCKTYEDKIRSLERRVEELSGRAATPGGRTPFDAWDNHQPEGWLSKTNLARPK